ncbi:MAG TPA: hypothetical protein VEQ85_04810, partial [Lacipirellulaceae bacterium]|nr:hypothetical protein [Lacipirellulaceae bacterium]
MSRAQSLFDAPPPSPGPHSGVRGIYNPAATPPGPANAAGIPAATLTPPMQAEPDSRYELVREAPPENLAEAAAAAAVASPSAAIPNEGA